jgi:hypothetical protein
MKYKTLTLLLFWLILPSSAQQSVGRRINVEIAKGGKTVARVNLPQGTLKVQAKNIVYDESSDMVVLSGGCVVTIIQGKEQSLRLVGDEARVQAQEIEVQVDGGYPMNSPQMPLEALSSVIATTPTLSLFRLRWYFSMGSWGSSGTAVYNRRSHTLRVYATGGDETGGYREGFVYTGVTEDMFRKMAGWMKKSGESGSTGPLSFNQLTAYGAVQRKIP